MKESGKDPLTTENNDMEEKIMSSRQKGLFSRFFALGIGETGTKNHRPRYRRTSRLESLEGRQLLSITSPLMDVAPTESIVLQADLAGSNVCGEIKTPDVTESDSQIQSAQSSSVATKYSYAEEWAMISYELDNYAEYFDVGSRFSSVKTEQFPSGIPYKYSQKFVDPANGFRRIRTHAYERQVSIPYCVPWNLR